MVRSSWPRCWLVLALTLLAAVSTLQAAGLVGDINNDGIVDVRDYGVWRAAFGQNGCGNPADLNGDCIVDIRDYGIWRQNFGTTAGAPQTAASGPARTPTPSATSTPARTPTPSPTLPPSATPTASPTAA